MLAQLQQRDVPAPRVPADDGTLRVGDPALDEIRESGVHVLELRPADVRDERVAPLPAVADGAAVVDHPDGEAGVDVRLHLRLPAVEVEPRRPAVDEHQHRKRAARIVRRDEEAVHALPVGILEVPRLVRPRRWRALAEREDLGARVVEDEPLPLALLVREPHAPVRADTRLPDVAGLGRDRGEPSRRDVVAVQVRPTLVDVVEQERGAVGPPVAHEDLTVEVELEPLEVARLEVPDRGPSVAVAFVVARETLVTGHGRPAASGQRHPLRRAALRRSRPCAGRSRGALDE